MIYQYGLFQYGMMVAAVNAANKQRALAVILNYAAQYAQDGPVEIREINLDDEEL